MQMRPIDRFLLETTDPSAWKLAVHQLYQDQMSPQADLASQLLFHFEKFEIATSHLAHILYNVKRETVHNLTAFWAVDIPLSFIAPHFASGAVDVANRDILIHWADVQLLYERLQDPELPGPRAIAGAKLLHIAASAAYSDISHAKGHLRGTGWGVSDQEKEFASACPFPISESMERERLAMAIKKNITDIIK
jgi:hypothetical protein